MLLCVRSVCVPGGLKVYLQGADQRQIVLPHLTDAYS